jgi:hypothetical protein
MALEPPPYEKFYKCTKIIIEAWKGREGYELDADRAMGIIDDLIQEGKILWDEDKITEDLADFLALDKKTFLESLETEVPDNQKVGLFPKRTRMFWFLFVGLFMAMCIMFGLQKCSDTYISDVIWLCMR